MVMRAVRRLLTRHRRVPIEQIKEYRKNLIRYKGGEYRLMEQRLLRQLQRDKTLQAHLDTSEHDYLLDIILTEEADLIVIHEMPRGLHTISVNFGNPRQFNQLHKGGQFRYKYIWGKLYTISQHRSVELLLNYEPTLVLKAKYQYA